MTFITLFRLLFTLILAFFVVPQLPASELQPTEVAHPVYEYTRPDHVEQVIWDVVAPHFLPSNHPVKPKLDKIFSSSRVTANEKSVGAAGFTKPKARRYSDTTVTGHPKLKGYLIKLVRDDQDLNDWEMLLERIKGARLVEECIKKHA